MCTNGDSDRRQKIRVYRIIDRSSMMRDAFRMRFSEVDDRHGRKPTLFSFTSFHTRHLFDSATATCTPIHFDCRMHLLEPASDIWLISMSNIYVATAITSSHRISPFQVKLQVFGAIPRTHFSHPIYLFILFHLFCLAVAHLHFNV